MESTSTKLGNGSNGPQRTTEHALKFDKMHIEKLRQATPEEIEANDKLVEEAMRLFFMNNVRDAEVIMDRIAPLDPLHALGACCLTTLKCLLSLGVGDTKFALEKVDFAIAFSTEVATVPTGILSSVKSLFRKGAEREFQPGMFRAKTIRAQSLAIRGIVLTSQHGDIMALIRGGMALKHSYKLLQALKRELEDLKEKKGADSYEDLGVDRNSLYGLLLMLGSTQVIISLLPPRVLAILSFLGIGYDREYGMQLLSAVWESSTLFSPFAALFLMVMTSFVPGFCSLHVPRWLPVAKVVAESTVQRSPMTESLLHLWILGRIQRLEQKLEDSILTLNKCLKTAEEGQVAQWMPQLRDFAIYDQGWNFSICRRWAEAVELYRRLEDHSTWSKLFYGYAQACCYDMLVLEAEEIGDNESAAKWKKNASEALWRTAHYSIRIMGGGAVSIDEFIAVRLAEIFERGSVSHPNKGNKHVADLTPFPQDGLRLRNPVGVGMMELLAVFDITHQMPQEATEKFLEVIDKVSGRGDELSQRGPASSDSDPCDSESFSGKDVRNTDSYTVVVCAAVKANLLCRLQCKHEEAKASLEKALRMASKFKGRKCSLSWIVPQMLYERAILALAEGDQQRSKLLKEVKESNQERLFQNVMDNKLHLMEYGMQTPVIDCISKVTPSV